MDKARYEQIKWEEDNDNAKFKLHEEEYRKEGYHNYGKVKKAAEKVKKSARKKK